MCPRTPGLPDSCRTFPRRFPFHKAPTRHPGGFQKESFLEGPRIFPAPTRPQQGAQKGQKLPPPDCFFGTLWKAFSRHTAFSDCRHAHFTSGNTCIASSPNMPDPSGTCPHHLGLKNPTSCHWKTQWLHCCGHTRNLLWKPYPATNTIIFLFQVCSK